MANSYVEIRNGVSDEIIIEEVQETGADVDGIGGDQEQSCLISVLDNFEFAFMNNPCWKSMREATRNLHLKTWLR